MSCNTDRLFLLDRNIHGATSASVNYVMKQKHIKQTIMMYIRKSDASLIKATPGHGEAWWHHCPGGDSCLGGVTNEELPLIEGWRWSTVIQMVLNSVGLGLCRCLCLYKLMYQKTTVSLFFTNKIYFIKLLHWMHSVHGDHSGHRDVQASLVHPLTDYLTNFSPSGSIHGKCLPYFPVTVSTCWTFILRVLVLIWVI